MFQQLMLSLAMGALLATILAVPVSARPADSSVTTWPAPSGEPLFEDYMVTVNGKPVPVYACRVSAMPFNQVWPGYQRPMDQSELAGFAAWEMAGPVTVEVTVHRPFSSVAVRPSSRKIKFSVTGDRIRFRLPRPGQFTVELDGQHHALHLFADAPAKDAPKEGAPDVLYFGPGVHHPGKIQLKSGQTLYVAGGAVVYTAVDVRGAAGVKILGRGVIDTSEYERDKGGGCIRLTDSSDVTIDGVILRDPDVWCLAAFGCHDVAISNVKLVGLWRYNSDGIDLCNCQNMTVRDSFIRAFDDAMVLKGLNWGPGSFNDRLVRNIHVSGLVVWCDWGRALEIGAETSAPEYSGVVFEDCDVIRTTHVALDIQAGDRAQIHDVHYRNIRVEVDDRAPSPAIQNGREATYDPRLDSGYKPCLLVIDLTNNIWSQDKLRGLVHDITFKDITVTGGFPTSWFRGIDAEHGVRNVSISNLKVLGRRAASAAAAKLDIGHFVEDVRFEK